MECLLHPQVDYHRIFGIIKNAKKELLEIVKTKVSNQLVYGPLPDQSFLLNEFKTRMMLPSNIAFL